MAPPPPRSDGRRDEGHTEPWAAAAAQWPRGAPAAPAAGPPPPRGDGRRDEGGWRIVGAHAQEAWAETLVWCLQPEDLHPPLAHLVERLHLEEGDVVNMKSDQQFTRWMFQQPRGGVSPWSVLVSTWRHAKPCMAAIAAARSGNVEWLRENAKRPQLKGVSKGHRGHISVAVGAMIIFARDSETELKARSWAKDRDPWVSVAVASSTDGLCHLLGSMLKAPYPAEGARGPEAAPAPALHGHRPLASPPPAQPAAGPPPLGPSAPLRLPPPPPSGPSAPPGRPRAAAGLQAPGERPEPSQPPGRCGGPRPRGRCQGAGAPAARRRASGTTPDSGPAGGGPGRASGPLPDFQNNELSPHIPKKDAHAAVVPPDFLLSQRVLGVATQQRQAQNSSKRQRAKNKQEPAMFSLTRGSTDSAALQGGIPGATILDGLMQDSTSVAVSRCSPPPQPPLEGARRTSPVTGQHEVRPLPDIFCTKLCPKTLQGEQCLDRDCKLAHSEELPCEEKAGESTTDQASQRSQQSDLDFGDLARARHREDPTTPWMMMHGLGVRTTFVTIVEDEAEPDRGTLRRTRSLPTLDSAGDIAVPPGSSPGSPRSGRAAALQGPAPLPRSPPSLG